MKKFLIILILLISSIGYSDEISVRYGAQSSTASLTNVSLDGGSKEVEVVYDHIFNQFPSLYIETGAGFFPVDFNSGGQSPVVEASPGIQVKAGPVRLRVSQGVAELPNNPSIPSFEYVTHMNLSLLDDKTGVSIGIEATHFSNGQSINNPGMDMTGLIVGFKF